MMPAKIFDQTIEMFSTIVSQRGLGSEKIQVTVGPISAEQAIGNPGRNDFALLEGTEVMVEAQFRGSFGHAFTDQPRTFEGTINDLFNLNSAVSSDRAVFYSTINAVAADLGIVKGTRHCRDDEPEKCASKIAGDLFDRFQGATVGIIGYQPAILDHLVQKFGVDGVRCSDLNLNNIGSLKSGSRLLDGWKDNTALIKSSDPVLVTSSTIVNGSFDDIYQEALSREKHIIVFGVTGAAVSALLGLERVCHFAH